MSDLYLNSRLEPEERAKALLEELSVEEKVYQICGMWIDGAKNPENYAYGIGHVSALEMREFKSLQECVEVQKELQKKIMESSPHHIPAIFHMEGLCGAFIQDAVSFPSGVGRGSSFDLDLEKKIGEIVGRQERAVGITQTLAPVLDVTYDPRMGRCGEAYGEDPILVGALGAAYTEGLQQKSKSGLQTDGCAKHFLGFHHSTGAIHGADASVSQHELVEKYGYPFQQAISQSKLRGIMPCYCSYNGMGVSADKNILTDLLRDEMGFDGCVISDYGAISNLHHSQALFESVEEGGYESIAAGMDVELTMREAFNDTFINHFKDGTWSVEILDKAVMRLLTAKFRMGLFEHPYALTGDDLQKDFYQEKDREVSLRSARESMILLKNDGTLPIHDSVHKIVVVGAQADNARFFFGGYTHLSMSEALFAAGSSMAGVEMVKKVHDAGYEFIPGTHIQDDRIPEMDELLAHQKPDCRSLYEELCAKWPEKEIVKTYGYPIAGDDCTHHEEALEAMKGADLIVFMLGGKHGSCAVSSMGEGVDGTDINLPVCQDGLIEKASALQIPMVGIHMNGRPISSDIADRYLNAIIETWNPSEMGAIAIAETLSGENNPSGKLPVTVAYHSGQLPIHYNHVTGSSWNQAGSIGFLDYVDLPHRPRYYFGHGLSYTSFAYDGFSIEKEQCLSEEKIVLHFTLENIGKVFGTEVVQIYVRDVYASVMRPVKQLIAFARVDLEVGEKKAITVFLNPEMFALLDRKMKWKIEKGEYVLMVGSSSEEIYGKESITISEDRFITATDRCVNAEWIIQ